MVDLKKTSKIVVGNFDFSKKTSEKVVNNYFTFRPGLNRTHIINTALLYCVILTSLAIVDPRKIPRAEPEGLH